MKRFAVGVKTGFTFHGRETSWQYTTYYFDTYTEARKFAARYPKGDTYLMDLARLPF